MMVTVKYVIIILRADNDGEGGTFSTYSLLSRYVSLRRPLIRVHSRLLTHLPDEHYEQRSQRVFSCPDE